MKKLGKVALGVLAGGAVGSLVGVASIVSCHALSIASPITYPFYCGMAAASSPMLDKPEHRLIAGAAGTVYGAACVPFTPLFLAASWSGPIVLGAAGAVIGGIVASK